MRTSRYSCIIRVTLIGLLGVIVVVFLAITFCARTAKVIPTSPFYPQSECIISSSSVGQSGSTNEVSHMCTCAASTKEISDYFESKGAYCGEGTTATVVSCIGDAEPFGQYSVSVLSVPENERFQQVLTYTVNIYWLRSCWFRPWNLETR